MADERPLLTLDLDGVLCRPPFGINPGRGQTKRRDRPGKRDLLWFTESLRYRGRRPMPGAVEGLRLLRERFRCVVVTGRAERVRGYTEHWFERHFGFRPELRMRPHWRETSAQFKVRTVGELEPLAHFEDDPHTAEWLAETLPAVFLIDWWRNRWLAGERIYRVERLEEALPVLDALIAEGLSAPPPLQG